MPTYINTTTLSRSQVVPVYIPDPATVRVFKKIYGDSWSEMDRVDLSDAQATDSYSYDENINVFLFHPLLIGSTIQVQYEHNNVSNPGTLDLLPNILALQSTHNYNKILSGLHINRSYMEGLYSGWNGYTAVLNGGMARLEGDIYTVGDTYWDLNKFGAQSGRDIVTTTLFYLYERELSDVQRRSSFIESPTYMTTSRYALDGGGGISSSLTELNDRLASKFGELTDTSGFIEVLRMVIVSKEAPSPPDVHFTYEHRFRFSSWL